MKESKGMKELTGRPNEQWKENTGTVDTSTTTS